jgi:hypothetical protein
MRVRPAGDDNDEARHLRRRHGCDAIAIAIAIAIPTSTLRSAATPARGVRSWSLHGRATTCPCG